MVIQLLSFMTPISYGKIKKVKACPRSRQERVQPNEQGSSIRDVPGSVACPYNQLAQNFGQGYG